MSIESFRPIEVPVEYKEVDLQDFNDTRIKMDGEFDIPRHLKDAFYMQLGSDVLEITRLLQGESGMQTFGESAIFVLRHKVRDGYIGNHLAIVNGQSDEEEVELGSFSLRRQPIVNIGSVSTPELELGNDVEPEHAQVRVGVGGGMNVMDLDTATGTGIWVPRSLELDHQRREFRVNEGFRHLREQFDEEGRSIGITTREAEQGAWTR